jgi:hypothetical protein
MDECGQPAGTGDVAGPLPQLIVSHVQRHFLGSHTAQYELDYLK